MTTLVKAVIEGMVRLTLRSFRPSYLARLFKNEEYYIWSLLFSVYGLKNEKYYIWGALVLLYGL